MKIRITLKDPDYSTDPEVLSEEQDNAVRELLLYSEYLTVELDTDTGDVRVIRPGELK